MTRDEGVVKEMSNTTRWGLGILVGIFLQSAGMVYWLGSWTANVEARIEQNSKDVAVLKDEINDVEGDIRAILIGVEQVKARLGIVEAQ